MKAYKIIGIMTGNSMDAIDMVLTEFVGKNIRDICTFSQPYTPDMQQRAERLRAQVRGRNREQISALPDFEPFHNDYVRQIADCVNQMCAENQLDKNRIDAIGFHGKTLDHNPPSKARRDGSQPYTLQIGSGQMLADLTGIQTVYDFRSDYIMRGFEGAPLVAPHNAHIAQIEGDGCYYNGGNTANFALIQNGKALIYADAGPFNEYVDNYIRTHTALAFDKDGQLGSQGCLNKELLQKLFDLGRAYYDAMLPKSGDPAYYKKSEVFALLDDTDCRFVDKVRTLEYFAAYIAAQALTLVPSDIELSPRFVWFGGGWKNPVVGEDFRNLLRGDGYVLPEHEKAFAELQQRLGQSVTAEYSKFGTYMEARLFAELAYYYLTKQTWALPEVINTGQSLICGISAQPHTPQKQYTDMFSRAAKGWSSR